MTFSIEKTNKILTFLILVFCLILLVLILVIKTGDCDLCKFEYEGKNISADRFMKIYSLDCFHQNFSLGLQSIPLNLLNQTEDNSP